MNASSGEQSSPSLDSFRSGVVVFVIFVRKSLDLTMYN